MPEWLPFGRRASTLLLRLLLSLARAPRSHPLLLTSTRLPLIKDPFSIHTAFLCHFFAVATSLRLTRRRSTYTNLHNSTLLSHVRVASASLLLYQQHHLSILFIPSVRVSSSAPRDQNLQPWLYLAKDTPQCLEDLYYYSLHRNDRLRPLFVALLSKSICLYHRNKKFARRKIKAKLELEEGAIAASTVSSPALSHTSLIDAGTAERELFLPGRNVKGERRMAGAAELRRMTEDQESSLGKRKRGADPPLLRASHLKDICRCIFPNTGGQGEHHQEWKEENEEAEDEDEDDGAGGRGRAGTATAATPEERSGRLHTRPSHSSLDKRQRHRPTYWVQVLRNSRKVYQHAWHKIEGWTTSYDEVDTTHQ